MSILTSLALVVPVEATVDASAVEAMTQAVVKCSVLSDDVGMLFASLSENEKCFEC